MLLQLETGVYFSLNPMGSRIWDLVQEERTVGELQTATLLSSEVDQDVLKNDILKFLEDMLNEGLIEIC